MDEMIREVAVTALTEKTSCRKCTVFTVHFIGKCTLPMHFSLPTSVRWEGSGLPDYDGEKPLKHPSRTPLLEVFSSIEKFSTQPRIYPLPACLKCHLSLQPARWAHESLLAIRMLKVLFTANA